MNILFITNRKDHKVTCPTVGYAEGKKYVKTYLDKVDTYGLDFETPSLHPRSKQALLLALDNYVDNFRIVVDLTSIPLNGILTQDMLKSKTMIAHNAKFDYSWLKSNNLDPTNVFCTMVAEQKILQGSSAPMNLVEVCSRRGVKLETDKDIRSKFYNAPLTIVFEDEDIEYAAKDVAPLKRLKEIQDEIIHKQNLRFLVYAIHMRLLKVLGKAEMTGFACDVDKWMGYINEIKEEVRGIEEELDEFIKDLDLTGINKKREEALATNERVIERLHGRIEKNLANIERLESTDKTHLKSYENSVTGLRKAREELAIRLNNAHRDEALINWSSPQQILEVFRRMGMNPLPMGKDPKTKKYKPALKKDARNMWLSENVDSPLFLFFKKFHEYKNTVHVTTAFGEKWIDRYVQEDGKVYTIFRQAAASTGRFTCGDRDHGFFNLQQVPKKSKRIGEDEIALLRESLGTDPGRRVMTFDFTGCEIVCMVGLSGDLDLKEVAELDDQHSYLGTKCWRNVYDYRYKQTGDSKWKELAETYEMGRKDKARDKFKNSGAFPVIYGVHSAKVASIQGFSKEEGQIFINTIEAEMPKVVTFVKEKAEEAMRTGKVTHNSRTNSYRLFDKIIAHSVYGDEITFMDEVDVRSAARNSPIQGTNADLICEGIVWVERWANMNNLDIRLLGQVHDEVIYDFPAEYESWAPEKIKALHCRAANNYLIPEISMDGEYIIKDTWAK